MTTATILDREIRSPQFDYAKMYPDTGCDLAPKCLSCPFPQCRYDAPISVQTSERNSDILTRFYAGDDPRAIAKSYGISRRHVFRLVAHVRGQRTGKERESASGCSGAPEVLRTKPPKHSPDDIDALLDDPAVLRRLLERLAVRGA